MKKRNKNSHRKKTTPIKPIRNGRPPAYDTEEKLNAMISEYLTSLRMFQIPSKAGLFYHLDISRETYSQYKKKFPDAIRRANNAIEAAWVQRLSGQSATGSIFYLKNAFKENYKDKYEHDNKIAIKPTPLLGGDSKKNGNISKNNGDGKNTQAK